MSSTANVPSDPPSAQLLRLVMPASNRNPSERTVLFHFEQARKRVFIFDYDGTLTPIVSNPADANMSIDRKVNLENLCKAENTSVWVVSGRDKNFLDEQLGWCIPDLNIVAEHGSYVRLANATSWEPLFIVESATWKTLYMPHIEGLVEEFPGSTMEVKDFSLTWHYRNVQDRRLLLGAIQVLELYIAICVSQQGARVRCVRGLEHVEIRRVEANKGRAIDSQVWPRAGKDADFIFCAGDDTTDADMFRALWRLVLHPENERPVKLHTCFVGLDLPCDGSKWQTNSSDELSWLIEKFLALNERLTAQTTAGPSDKR